MPCLLLRGRALVKTVQFQSAKYVGDPINTVRIYNEKEIDELIFLDITATSEKRRPSFSLLEEIATECFMPFTYGGGVRSLEDVKRLLELGAEKVAINSFAFERPEFVSRVAEAFGSQSVVASIDVKRSNGGRHEVYTLSGQQRTGLDPVEYALRMEQLGAGEILLTSIDCDGVMGGYDIDVIRRVSRAVSIPVIACGGAGSVTDFGRAVRDGGASAVAAGSMVVYQGKNRAVVINFPTREELASVLDVAEPDRRETMSVGGLRRDPAQGVVTALHDADQRVRRCARCLYDATTPGIVFDNRSVCSYCRLHDDLCREYPSGSPGQRRLEEIASQIKKDGRNKAFDVVVGVSGGCDSSYMAHLTKELGLRALAAHYDNTWNSKIATENIYRVLRKLDIELFTYVVDNEEGADIFRSFMLAGVPEIDGPTDIGLATTLYMAAAKYGVRYIFEGHSFRTEGVSPLGWVYVDGKYIESVHRTYGTRPLRTFPNLWLSSFLWYSAVKQIKRIRPLWYIEYRKEETKKFLSDTFGWQWYGGHHLENRFTAFNHWYYYVRYGIDQRLNGYSALIRSGQMCREEGLSLIQEPPKLDPDIIDMVKKRLGFSDGEFEQVLQLPRRTYRDFTTYKSTFERLRPLFWLLYRLELVPKSFYIKYTARSG